MRERKGDSLFSFRRSRSSNRYSLHLERQGRKEEEEEGNVQLKRASWSSFPLLKFSAFDDRSSTEQLSASAAVKSHSSDHIRHPPVTSPKIGCGFLRGSTASIRSAFSSSSSSSSSTSSSSIRSTCSSGKSSITSILEGSDSQYDSGATADEEDPEDRQLFRSASDVVSPLGRARVWEETWSIPQLPRDDGGNASCPTSPRILYAHRKTPDVKRKSRKQLLQELETAKSGGSLPRDLPRLKSQHEKENLSPKEEGKRVAKPKSHFRFLQGYRFLPRQEAKTAKMPAVEGGGRVPGNPAEGYQMTPDEREADNGEMRYCGTKAVQDQPTPAIPVQKPLSPPTPPADENSEGQGEGNGIAKVVSEGDFEVNPILTASNPSAEFIYPLRPQLTKGFFEALNPSFGTNLAIYGATCTNSTANGKCFGALSANFGVISDIIEEEEDSECDMSVQAEDSSCFEKRLEDKLEMLADRETDVCLEGVSPDTLANQSSPKRPDLKLNLVSPQNKIFNQVNRIRLLRHISEEGDGGVSCDEEEVELRTPSTPRSPAIDIDNVFKKKQREIEESSDDMSKVRDLATKLKLATRRPSYLDWMGQIKQRGEKMTEVLETHTPLVLEEGQQEELLTEEKRKENLQNVMDWLRKELLEMRQQDQQLARQLMQLRIELQRIKLLRSCNHHQALVDEVTNEAEEAKTYESSDLCELPPDLRETFSPILREIGVTRMNITSRRFSLR